MPKTLAASLALVATLALMAGAPARAEEADWADLAAYAQRDADLAARGAVAHRVVFMGDSITEGWDRDHQGLFADPTHINRGISGQTTGQMLLRFRQDVLSLEPAAVVILGGTNDIAGNGGPVSDETLRGNIQSMAELARAHHIRVLLLAVPPTDHFWWARDVQPAARIKAHNAWLRSYAQAQHFAFVDSHAPLANAQGGIAETFSRDGVHPNAAGYRVLEGVIAASLREVAQ